MLIEIYLVLQVVVIALFLISFFTKQEILWVVTLVTSALMMFSSFGVEKFIQVYNVTISAYTTTLTSFSYPYLMGLNAVFFCLAMVLGFFDMFDKYRREKGEK